MHVNGYLQYILTVQGIHNNNVAKIINLSHVIIANWVFIENITFKM